MAAVAFATTARVDTAATRTVALLRRDPVMGDILVLEPTALA
jgi:hypothetical protein